MDANAVEAEIDKILDRNSEAVSFAGDRKFTSPQRRRIREEVLELCDKLTTFSGTHLQLVYALKAARNIESLDNKATAIERYMEEGKKARS